MPAALEVVRKYFPNVKRVIDATKSIVVDVTPGDQKATRRDHSGCALAVACRRQFHAQGAIISTATSYIIKKDVAIRYKNNETVSREVVSFDRSSDFEPGRYSLRAPGVTERLGHTPVGKAHGTSKGSRKLKPHHVTTNIRARMGS